MLRGVIALMSPRHYLQKTLLRSRVHREARKGAGIPHHASKCNARRSLVAASKTNSCAVNTLLYCVPACGPFGTLCCDPRGCDPMLYSQN